MFTELYINILKTQEVKKIKKICMLVWRSILIKYPWKYIFNAFCNFYIYIFKCLTLKLTWRLGKDATPPSN